MLRKIRFHIHKEERLLGRFRRKEQEDIRKALDDPLLDPHAPIKIDVISLPTARGLTMNFSGKWTVGGKYCLIVQRLKPFVCVERLRHTGW